MKNFSIFNLLNFLYKNIPGSSYIKNKLNIPTPTIKIPVNWNGIKFYFYAPIPIALKAKNKGIESSLLRSCKKIIDLNKINTIIDVGANYGFLTVVFSKYVSDLGGRVYSFEPHPKIFSSLRKTITSNKIKNIFLENYAVGDKECEIDINISNYTSNVLDIFGGNVKTKRIKQISLDKYFFENKSHSFDVKIDFIKIDVDGYEYQVLQGCKKIIEKYRPVLVVELNNDDRVVKFLKDMNYVFLNSNFDIEYDLKNKNVICMPGKYVLP